MVELHFFFLFLAETWNIHRRLIQPTFHKNILETFIGTFVDASQALVKKLNDGPLELNITHVVNQCVIDILNGKQLQLIFQLCERKIFDLSFCCCCCYFRSCTWCANIKEKWC